MVFEYESHPAANVFPLMAGPDYSGLVLDIKAKGLIDDIVRVRHGRTWLILDGRNRERACHDAGVEPRYRDYDGDDPLGFVVSVNLHRRHLNASQLAIVAGRITLLGRGRPKTGKFAGYSVSQKAAAEMLNVSERTVRDGRAVVTRAVPAVIAAVEQGDMAVSAAAELARHGRKSQHQHIAELAIGGNKGVRAQSKATQTSAMILSENDVVALNALVVAGDESHDPRARAGCVVLRRIVPALEARA